MASATTMYRLPKQVETPVVVDLPSCMYRMNPINKFASTDLSSSYYGSAWQSSLPQGDMAGLAELEKRQEAVLQRLQNLKLQLDKLQSNKNFTSQTSCTGAIPAIGAAAHSSPVKQPIGAKQAVVEHVLNALGSHLDDLSCLHFVPSPQEKSTTSHVESLPRSMLYRLGCLKEELNRMQETYSEQARSVPEKELKIADYQSGLMRVIDALKEELYFLRDLQDSEDPKKNVTEIDVVVQHREVVKKLVSLQGELSKLLRGLQDLSWETGTVHDMVISADPDKPPYSLVLLRKLLKDSGFPVYCANHLHSSIKEVNDSLQSIFTDSPEGDRSKHSLAFTIHWKDVPAPCLMVNPLRQTVISGEGNIVRYISRLFPLSSVYNYEASGTFTSITETDNLLDQLVTQMISGNNKEKQAVLRQLNGRLGKQPWLMGNKCSIVDVLAWSSVKQTGLDTGAPANVSKWYKAVNSLAGLESVSDTVSNTNAKNKQTPSKDAQKGNSANYIDRKGLENLLKSLNIKYQVKDHEEVFTVETLMKNVSLMPGLHMKNLFLKDKKKNLYLLSARHDVEVKLNDVAKSIGTKDLRFGDESVMFDVLGVKQGCVTAYALVNDKNLKVKFLLDAEAFNESHPYVNFHPISNAATLGISPASLKKFLNHTGHEATLVTF